MSRKSSLRALRVHVRNALDHAEEARATSLAAFRAAIARLPHLLSKYGELERYIAARVWLEQQIDRYTEADAKRIVLDGWSLPANASDYEVRMLAECAWVEAPTPDLTRDDIVMLLQDENAEVRLAAQRLMNAVQTA